MAAAIPIIKIVGIALSAKAAIDGIKEGNFFQAVLGGVGAYYGLSALATPATAGGAAGMEATAEGASQTANIAGANTAEQLATKAAAKGLEEGAAEAIKLGGDAAAKGLGSGAEIASKGGFSLNESLQKGASWLKDKFDSNFVDPAKEFMGGNDGAGTALVDGAKSEGMQSGGGLLSKAANFAKENPGLMQTGMNLAGGYLQGKAEEELYDDQKREFYKSLDRRGYSADVSGYTNTQFSPTTKRFN